MNWPRWPRCWTPCPVRAASRAPVAGSVHFSRCAGSQCSAGPASLTATARLAADGGTDLREQAGQARSAATARFWAASWRSSDRADVRGDALCATILRASSKKEMPVDVRMPGAHLPAERRQGFPADGRLSMKTVSRLRLPDFRFVRWRTIFATWAACGQGLELGMQLPLVELYGEGTVRSAHLRGGGRHASWSLWDHIPAGRRALRQVRLIRCRRARPARRRAAGSTRSWCGRRGVRGLPAGRCSFTGHSPRRSAPRRSPPSRQPTARSRTGDAPRTPAAITSAATKRTQRTVAVAAIRLWLRP